MLGQPASWQTVCSPSRFTSACSSVYCGPIRARVLIHSGLRSIGVCSVAGLDAQQPPAVRAVGGAAAESPVELRRAKATRPWRSARATEVEQAEEHQPADRDESQGLPLPWVATVTAVTVAMTPTMSSDRQRGARRVAGKPMVVGLQL